MTAKYFIYRNLRTKGFSVRHHGRVIDRLDELTASNVTFKVNQAGRRTATREGVRNVHAFVVAEHYSPSQCTPPGVACVRYNPFKQSTFEVDGEPIHSAALAYFHGGRCYVLHEESNPDIRG